MSDERTSGRYDGGEPSAEHDPVARFFATARAEVREDRATDLDWQRIVRGARRTSRRRSRLALLSSAAVAVLAIFAVFLWQQDGIGDGVHRGEAVVGATDQVVTGEPTSAPPSVSAQQTPTTVPASFDTWSVSNAGLSTLYALGSQTCGGDTCPVLLRSNTSGEKWNAVHRFTGTDVSAATGQAVPQIQPVRAITQTRFATPQTGYVFGGDLWVTHDAGASFTKMSHPGQTVLDVEINQNQAVLLSADNCGQGVCNGPVYVSRFDPAKNSIATADAEVKPSTQISGGTVVVQNGQAFIQLTPSDPSSAVAPMRLDDSTLTRVDAPPACRGASLQALTAATNTKNLLLFALCDPRTTADNHLSYTIVRSDDGGRSWRSISVGALKLPRLGQVSLAAADSQHLVASAGGPRETSGVPASSGEDSLMVSNNGGHGFGAATPPKGQQLPGTGFDWTASAGAGIVYAVPRTTHGFWSTTDFGASWSVIDPRP